MAQAQASTSDLSPDLIRKRGELKERLKTLERVLIAYSGGADSAFLAYMAFQVLGQSMRAVIADSPSLARSQLRDAVRFLEELGIPLDIVRTNELMDAGYVKNDGNRCFHCKDELFHVMERSRAALGFTHLAFGMNADDRREYRPGHRAAEAHGVLAPLAEAGLSKAEIRALARAENLRVWDKPASPCLSSRIEYGRPVTLEALARVEAGEAILQELGFTQFRVRYHGELARIEIEPSEMPRAFSTQMAKHLAARFKALGFLYVALDCEGYRAGSMNAVLPVTAIGQAAAGPTRKREAGEA